MIIKILFAQRCETSVLSRFARGPDSIERIYGTVWPTKSASCTACLCVATQMCCRFLKASPLGGGAGKLATDAAHFVNDLSGLGV